MYFKLGAQSWSDVRYILNGEDVPNAEQDGILDLAKARWRMLGADVVFDRVVVADVLSKNKTASTNMSNREPRLNAINENAYTNRTSYNLRAYDDPLRYRSEYYLRGLPDDWVPPSLAENPRQQPYGPVFSDLLAKYNNLLKGAGESPARWALRVRSKTTGLGTSYPLEAVTKDAITNQWIITATGAPFVEGDKVQLRQVRGFGLRGINGIKTVIKVVSAGVFRLQQRACDPCDPVIKTPGFVRFRPGYIFPEIKMTANVGYGYHDIGRAAGVIRANGRSTCCG